MNKIVTYSFTFLFALFTIGVHAEWHMCLSENSCHAEASDKHDCCSDEDEDEHDANSCCADTSISYYVKDASFLPTEVKSILPFFVSALIHQYDPNCEVPQTQIFKPEKRPINSSYPPPYIAFSNFKADHLI